MRLIHLMELIPVLQNKKGLISLDEVPLLKIKDSSFDFTQKVELWDPRKPDGGTDISFFY